MTTPKNDDGDTSREMLTFEVAAALDEIEYGLEHIRQEIAFARRYLKRLAQ